MQDTENYTRALKHTDALMDAIRAAEPAPMQNEDLLVLAFGVCQASLIGGAPPLTDEQVADALIHYTATIILMLADHVRKSDPDAHPDLTITRIAIWKTLATDITIRLADIAYAEKTQEGANQ